MYAYIWTCIHRTIYDIYKQYPYLHAHTAYLHPSGSISKNTTPVAPGKCLSSAPRRTGTASWRSRCVAAAITSEEMASVQTMMEPLCTKTYSKTLAKAGVTCTHIIICIYVYYHLYIYIYFYMYIKRYLGHVWCGGVLQALQEVCLDHTCGVQIITNVYTCHHGSDIVDSNIQGFSYGPLVWAPINTNYMHKTGAHRTDPTRIKGAHSKGP